MVFIFKKRYYFDSGSFTPIHPKAAHAARCVLQVQRRCGMGNPVATHQPGRNAKEYLEQARTMLARRYQIKAGNVVFTSGATDANALAFRTAVLHAKRRGIALADMHIIVGNEEHSSVYKHIALFSNTRCAMYCCRTKRRSSVYTNRHHTPYSKKYCCGFIAVGKQSARYCAADCGDCPHKQRKTSVSVSAH